MLERSYTDLALRQAMALLAIDSPTGFTEKAAQWVQDAFAALGYDARRTVKGGVLIDLGGKNADDALLLEKTPCFIWSADLQPMKVDKTLNTSDLLPTMLNLLGVDSPYDYIGRDAFDPTYEGYALFSDGSWISGDIAYDAGTKRVLSITGGEAEASSETLDAMAQKVQQFVRINNLILDTDYYKDNTAAN